jgi:hypothetical protein
LKALRGELWDALSNLGTPQPLALPARPSMTKPKKPTDVLEEAMKKKEALFR